ncbi:transposase [Alkalicella caledoniensis]|uniref:Transposase n=1 Tax=Alkalicella caledoniensis TaxID=2731377 RepID=A0A7G9WBP0_ALKCA|nr:helix-turn-helix domain-containing protein [Alkalicella caledoniensis]QNO16102.1 transposase [Alkalicella caledoniensis]
MAIKEYLSGKGSLHDICFQYGIRSTGILHTWVMKYNSYEKLKSSGTGGVSIMTKGRKTHFDERVEIVKYCIENKCNYVETAQKFNVSYQQVNSWTNKYLKKGIEALQDKRGKRKSEDDMSEMDKLKAQNKLLEAEIRQKQMEIDFLKKLKEIERGRF